jgi:hypothetical protein
MTNKITPQQAFEAAKVLWPDTVRIEKRGQGALIYVNDTDYVATAFPATIDWPSGVDRWPMPEPKWRNARMPEDYGKQARFSDGHGTHDYLLSGLLPSGEHRYVDSHGVRWRYCQVRDEVSP